MFGGSFIFEFSGLFSSIFSFGACETSRCSFCLSLNCLIKSRPNITSYFWGPVSIKNLAGSSIFITFSLALSIPLNFPPPLTLLKVYGFGLFCVLIPILLIYFCVMAEMFAPGSYKAVVIFPLTCTSRVISGSRASFLCR